MIAWLITVQAMLAVVGVLNARSVLRLRRDLSDVEQQVRTFRRRLAEHEARR